MFGLLADAVVFLHLAFVLLILLGGLLVLRWPWFAWVHLPLAAWGVLVQSMSWICPLTPLENWLRARAGGAPYQGGFVEHSVIPVLYAAAVGPRLHWVLGALVLGVNGLVYGAVVLRARRPRRNG
jgi:hypothetical protein